MADMRLQGQNLNGIMEIQWVNSYNWSAAVGGYSLCSVGRTGRRRGGGGRIPAEVRAAGTYGALYLGMDNETAEGLCVRMSRQTNIHDIEVGVCNGLPHHKKQMVPSSHNWKKHHIHSYRELELC